MRLKAFFIIPHDDVFDIKPLVRCKECKWWKIHGATSDRWLPCMVVHTQPYWFCADGEKGEENAKTDL